MEFELFSVIWGSNERNKMHSVLSLYIKVFNHGNYFMTFTYSKNLYLSKFLTTRCITFLQVKVLSFRINAYLRLREVSSMPLCTFYFQDFIYMDFAKRLLNVNTRQQSNNKTKKLHYMALSHSSSFSCYLRNTLTVVLSHFSLFAFRSSPYTPYTPGIPYGRQF